MTTTIKILCLTAITGIVIITQDSVRKPSPKVRRTGTVVQIHNGNGDNVGIDTIRRSSSHRPSKLIQIHNGNGDNIGGNKIIER